MVVAQRWDYRRLRALAPVLVLASLGLLVGGARDRAGRQRRAPLDRVRPGRLPALGAREARARGLGRRATSRAARRRARSAQLARPVGLLAGLYAVLLLAEPDLGTAIALMLMLAAMLLVAGTPARVLGLAAR